MAGKQHAAPLAAFFFDARAERGLHQRVKPCRRLVKDEQLRIGGERRDERDLLPVSLRVGARLFPRIEVEPLDQRISAFFVEPSAEPAEQVDHLAAGQVRPEGDIARHVSEPAVQRGGIVPGVAAEQARDSGVGAEQAEQDPDRRRLACSIRPEEAVHLPGPYVQIEAIERTSRPERFAQGGHFDHVNHVSKANHLLRVHPR